MILNQKRSILSLILLIAISFEGTAHFARADLISIRQATSPNILVDKLNVTGPKNECSWWMRGLNIFKNKIKLIVLRDPQSFALFADGIEINLQVFHDQPIYLKEITRKVAYPRYFRPAQELGERMIFNDQNGIPYAAYRYPEDKVIHGMLQKNGNEIFVVKNDGTKVNLVPILADRGTSLLANTSDLFYR